MKIATKIRLLSSGLALFSALAVGLVMYLGYVESIADLEVEVLEQRVEADVARLNDAFKEVSHDIRLLHGLPGVRELLNRSPRPIEDMKDDLAQTFRHLLLAKPHYVQVRLIGVDGEGREVVRLDREGERIVRRSEAELQVKGRRSYFLETRDNERGEIYYSDIDLNRENNRIEVPYRPMLRVAMPVYDDDETFRGIVIINLDFRGFAREFLGNTALRFDHYLCNSEGDFLLHPEENKTFGFDLGTRFRVQEEYPEIGDFGDSDKEAITMAINREDRPSGFWFHLRKVRPLEDGRVLLYGVAAGFEEVVSASHSIVRKTVLIMVVLWGLALAGALGVSLLITRPIERITQAARRLGEGSDDVDLPDARSDEIGTLATSFKVMRGAIKEQEGRILEANESLSQANRDLKHFAHISSHELREPLTRISGLASLLELSFQDSKESEATSFVKSVKEEAASALQQITDFRVFSHLGEGTTVRDKTDLLQLVQEVLEEFSPLIEAKEAVVSLGKLPEIKVYRNLVRVLYRNLVENALEYAQGKGTALAFTAERYEGCWTLGVFNTGSSIVDAEQDRVFRVFTRLNQEVEGTGLGLAICKRVVEFHSGRIWIESDKSSVHFKFILES
ncbi:ATP-binding protein [Pelagicoccus sp. SDUM812002]|uniref:sensor histidine kinase n=1 Tax=Pelagicoccus sp. SDUM812002 TaxID=3041266 RepID=UPI00280F122B|nr:ATP-binding protein [Pelagicoccus sp. SDUM812002]MDQ8184804.1 cache domain-containing protein [Pelagicoccus sp. SDUM812002]